MRNIILILLLLFIGCNQTSNEVTNFPKPDCEAMGFVNVQRWRAEILSIDSMTVNGYLPLISTIDNYTKELGAVRKVYGIQEEDIALYGNRSDEKKRYVFNGALVDTWGNQAIINALDFRLNDIEIVHPRIILKKGMSVAELCKLFPASCRLIPSNGNQWSGFIELKLSSSGFDFRRAILIFQREKLIKFKIIEFSFDI